MSFKTACLTIIFCCVVLIIVGAIYYSNSVLDFKFKTVASNNQTSSPSNKYKQQINGKDPKIVEINSSAALSEWLLHDDVTTCGNDDSCIKHQRESDLAQIMSAPPTYQCMVQFPIVNGEKSYQLCYDRPFRPIPKRCLVYSFGIDKSWTFEDQMASRGCDVFSFDPTLGLSEHRRESGVNFFPYKLFGLDRVVKVRDQNQPTILKRLTSIYKKLGHANRKIDILKVDVEDSERASFTDAMNSGFLQKNVKTILVKWHTKPDVSFGALKKLTNDGPSDQSALDTYHRLHNEAGFEAFYTEPQLPGVDGFSLVESLVNTRFIN